MTQLKLQCDHCDDWLPVADEPTVECDCGAVYAVTVTKVVQQSTEPVDPAC